MNYVPFLILPLVGGYAFSVIWEASLFHAAREEGHRLYFRSAFYGFVLILVAGLLHIWFFCDNYNWYKSLLSFCYSWTDNKEVSLTGSGSVALILSSTLLIGPTLGHILNIPRTNLLINWDCCGYKLFYKWGQAYLHSAIKNNDFELLVTKAFNEEKTLIITLENEKVYVGWPVASTNPTAKRKSLRILPMLSGYRNQEDKILNFTTDYFEVLDHFSKDGNADTYGLTPEDFEIVLPVERIITANIFDLIAYDKFQEQYKKGVAP